MAERHVLPQQVLSFVDACMTSPHPESYLIAVLQKVQEHFGYLSPESMDAVSQRMNIPAAKVTGVATFYHFFKFAPKGEHTFTLCMGTACYVRGAAKVIEKIESLLGIKAGETTADGRFSIEQARCIGACALAPVLVVGEKVYGNVQPSDVEGILREYGYGR